MQDEEEKTSMFRQNKPIEPERTVVAAPRQVARLKATLEDGMQTFLPLTSAPVTMTIGRDPSCGWYLQDLSVSRIHASIRWSGVALSIEDHGSSGGTFVANRQVGTTPCLVRPGDSVRVGDAIFVLELTSGIASKDVEQTRMVPNPSPMSYAVTPAPSRHQKPVEIPLGTSADDERTAFSSVAAPHAREGRQAAHDEEERTAFSKVATPARGQRAHAELPSIAALADEEKTAFQVELPNVVVASDATESEVELPIAESRPQRVAPAKPVAHAKPAPKPAPPVQQTRPTTPPKAIPAVKPAPVRPVAQPKPVAAEQQTTEAEIPLPEAAPWSKPSSEQTKTAAELPLPGARATQPRTEAEVRLPPEQARTATKTLPAHQLPTEAEIPLPEAKARAPLPKTEAHIPLPAVAAASRTASTESTVAPASPIAIPVRAPDHEPLVYVPESDVLAPTEVTRSWAVETALAKPKEGLFGARRGTVKSGMPVKKSAEGKSAIGKLAQLAKGAAKGAKTTAKTAKPSQAESTAKTWTLSSQRKRILLLAGPALLAIVTSASAWMQAPADAASEAKPAGAKHAKAHPANGAAVANGGAANGAAGNGAGGDGNAQPADPTAAVAPAAVAPVDSAARDELLAGAIRAYSDGNRAEALNIFRRMGPNDPTGRAMVHIITLQAEGQ